ncbi:nuclear protein 96-domain-containing protein [Zopfochytrium polystomum]|nr:nuclear protein 96-domain-containing protein [Zopfochytrium polystomum]
MMRFANLLTLNSGFGASSGFGTGAPGFGSSFGAGTTQGFGGAGSGFGAARPTFGATGSVFGGGATPAGGFGSFGATTQPSSFGGGTGFVGANAGFGNQTAGGFGSGLAGQSAFGAGSSAFGQTGMGVAGGGFGGPGQTTATSNCGTGNPTFAPTGERESAQGVNSNAVIYFQSVSAMPNYKNWSFEELRVQDYAMNKKFSTTSGPAGFGTGTFGQTNQAAGAFGSSAGGFGQSGAAGGIFGASQSGSSGFSFGTTGSSFGQTGTSVFGAGPSLGASATAFGSAPTASTGFGASSGTGFGFGSNTTKPGAFGSFGTNSATGAFGTSGTAFGGGTGTTGGIFGQKQPSSSTFGITQPAQQPTGFSSTFGGGIGGSTFGAQQPATSAGLFGRPPATQNTGFGLGQQTPATGLFGPGQPASTTSFGAGVGGFGSTPGFAAGQSSLFGGASNSGFSSGTSFGAKPGGLFGSTQTAGTPGFGGGGAGFGGGFGGTATPGFGSGFQSSLTGQATGLANTNLGGSLFSSSLGSNAPGPSLHASIDQSPYGNNPLFNVPAGSLSSSSSRTPKIFPTASIAESKKPAMLPHYKITPKSASKIKLRNFASSPSLREPSVLDGSPQAPPTGSVPKGVLNLLKGEADDSVSRGFPDAFKPRVKKLVLSGESGTNYLSPTFGSPLAPGTISNEPPSSSKSVRFVENIGDIASNSAAVDVTRDMPKSSSAPPQLSRESVGSPGDRVLNTGLVEKSSEQRDSKSSSPTRASASYETTPPIAELLDMSEEELRRLEGFVVTLPHVGCVRFLRPVNLIEASPTGTKEGVSLIPGRVIVFKHKMIEVYPEGTEKDPVGMGVNVPAEVHLERCWAVDKATGKIIQDETDPRFDRHFRKLQSIEGTVMLGYNTKTGTWKFRVEHFSKYGLDDDQDDDDSLFAAGDEMQDDDIAGLPIASSPDDIEEDDESIMDDSFADIKSRQMKPTARVTDLRTVVLASSGAGRVRRPESRLQNVISADETDPDSSGSSNEMDDDKSGTVPTSFLDEVFANAEPNPKVSLPFASSSSHSASRRVQIMRASLFEDSSSGSRSSVSGLLSVPPKRLHPSSGSSFKRTWDHQNGVAETTTLEEIVLSPRGLEFRTDESSGERVVPIIKSARFSPSHSQREFGPVEAGKILSPHSESPVQRVLNRNVVLDEIFRSSAPVGESTHSNFRESVMFGRQKLCVDSGLVMGRSCRVGWGPSGRFVVGGRFCGSSSFTSVRIVALNVFSAQSESDGNLRATLLAAERSRQISTLKVFLDHSSIVRTDSRSDGEEIVVPKEPVTPLTSESIFDGGNQLVARCPLVLLRPSLQFASVLEFFHSSSAASSQTLWNPQPSSSEDDPRRTITRSELDIWKLASAIWDSISLPHKDNEPLRLDSHRAEAILESMRKEKVSNWLRESVNAELEHELRKVTISPEETIFRLLCGRQIGRAVKVALASRNFRLASVIAQSGGPSSTVLLPQYPGESREKHKTQGFGKSASGHGVPGRISTSEITRGDVSKQLSVWGDMDCSKLISSKSLDLYNLLSGDVNRWEPLVGAPLSWKQTFGLFLWYANGGELSLRDALHQYVEVWSQSSSAAKSPVPSYLEGKPLTNEIVRRQGGSRLLLVQDIRFELLKLHADSTHLLETALNPLSVTPQRLDCRISWAIWAILARAKKVREFVDAGRPVTVKGPIDAAVFPPQQLASNRADATTMTLILGLEVLELWQWACFAALFLSSKVGRETVIRRILSQWYPLSDASGSCANNINVTNSNSDSERYESRDWEFIVEKLHIPAQWVHEAKALKAKYNGQDLEEAICLIDCRKFSEAHFIAIQKICPDCIINGEYELVKALLAHIPPHLTDSWTVGGGLVLQFIDCLEEGRAVIAASTQEGKLSVKLESMAVKVQSLILDLQRVPAFDGVSLPRVGLAFGQSNETDRTMALACKSEMIQKLTDVLDQAARLNSVHSNSFLAVSALHDASTASEDGLTGPNRIEHAALSWFSRQIHV